MRAILICVSVTSLLAGNAAASQASDAVRDFGLMGEWALDCSKPPALDNPHMIFATKDNGQPTKTLQMKSSFDGTFELRDARVLASDRMTYVETDSYGTYTIVLGMTNNHWRSMDSTRHSDGKVLIKDGKSTGSGGPTPLFAKCGASP